MKIVTITLILLSAALSMRHGRQAFRPASDEQVKMMADIGLRAATMPYVGALSILTGIMLLIPQTYLLSNIISAMIIVLVMALSLNGGNYKTALIEIPFLALPMLLIWLKHPLKAG